MTDPISNLLARLRPSSECAPWVIKELEAIIATNMKAQAMVEPPVGLLISMALRHQHAFGLLDESAQLCILAKMHQLWEEVVGLGFYRPNKEEQYSAPFEKLLNARQTPWKNFSTSAPAPRDYPEDAGFENGAYACKCSQCTKYFIGHKRRVICKVCSALTGNVYIRPNGVANQEGQTIVEATPDSTLTQVVAEMREKKKSWEYDWPYGETVGEWTDRLAAISLAASVDDAEKVRVDRVHWDTPFATNVRAEPVAWIAEGKPSSESTMAYVLGRRPCDADEYRKNGWNVRPLIYGDTAPPAAPTSDGLTDKQAACDKCNGTGIIPFKGSAEHLAHIAEADVILASWPASDGLSDWVLVPREPTSQMIGAGLKEIGAMTKYGSFSASVVYRAMLAASPHGDAAAQEGGE